jgi:uncharacterized protein (TIGR03435 family)
MKDVLAAVAAASVVFLASADTAPMQSAQEPAGERRFEVASVKPALSPAELGAQAARAAANGTPVPAPRFGIDTLPGGRFTAMSTLKQLVANAFDVRDYQIDGGPKWLTSDYFDINATAGADATPADVRAMLRALLAERFALRAHSETREAPVHVLTIARSDGRLGSQLKPTSQECIQQLEDRKKGLAAAPPVPSASREFPTAPRCGLLSMMTRVTGGSTISIGGMELSSLVRQISSELSAPVDDRTGLSGLFDITLDYLSERRIGTRANGLDPNSTDTTAPPMAAALQQQLGLRLEKQSGALPIVVIDAAELPTPD